MSGIRRLSAGAFPRRGWVGCAAVVLLSLVSCRADAPTSIRPLDGLSLAKGGSGSGGGGAAPTVTATDPAFTVRDTTLDVTVFGTGFTTGAKATWSVAGDTSQVHVKSTKVVSSTQLVARIAVPAGAAVASYDVEVTLSNGKKGVGAEMFEVLLGDPAASFWLPTDDPSLSLQSDGAFLDGNFSVYASGVCGVNSKIFATASASNSGDAIMHTNNPASKDRRCAEYPRRILITYGPGDTQATPTFLNVREIANTSYRIPVGETARRALRMNDARCDGLVFIGQVDGVVTGADSVNVTRTASDTWVVESRPFPDNRAYCRATGQMYHISVRFKVVASHPLP